MSDQPQLDWNAAEVREGTLTIEVGGEFDDGWEQTFVRFALDGAVQEATAHHARDDSEESDKDQEPEDADDSEGGDTDRRMTERFRDSAE